MAQRNGRFRAGDSIVKECPPFARGTCVERQGKKQVYEGSTMQEKIQTSLQLFAFSGRASPSGQLVILIRAMQPRFGMIEVALNAAQNFVIDDIFIAQLNNGPAFHIERVLLQALV